VLRKAKTGLACCLLGAAVFCTPTVANAWYCSNNQNKNTCFILDNPGDPNFNQLLGISNHQVIVGYFGANMAPQDPIANNGYVLVPPNHYSVENFTNFTPPGSDTASQTQAIGISNREIFPAIVGFYTDANTTFTHGFLDYFGVQYPIDDPKGTSPTITAPVQNLLGVNRYNEAAGFWTDNNGKEHGFVVRIDIDVSKSSINSLNFIEIPLTTFNGAVATQASNITDDHIVCGFWTDGNANNHGFVGLLGDSSITHVFSFDVKIYGTTATSTSVFGCNNRGEIVGNFILSNQTHGFIFTHGRFIQYDPKGSSQTTILGVQGTFINAINDKGNIVGFFSDGVSKVDGFVDYNPLGYQEDRD